MKIGMVSYNINKSNVFPKLEHLIIFLKVMLLEVKLLGIMLSGEKQFLVATEYLVVVEL